MKKEQIVVHTGDILKERSGSKFVVISYATNTIVHASEIEDNIKLKPAPVWIDREQVGPDKRYSLTGERWVGPMWGDIVGQTMLSEEVVSLRKKVDVLERRLNNIMDWFKRFG